MDSYQFPVNIMKDFDSKMVKFFHFVLRHELDVSLSYADAFRTVKKAYHKETRRLGNSVVSFSSSDMRCAYVYYYSSCFSKATAYHFLQLLKSDTTLLLRIIFQDTFRLCCLGGGPGTEVVAIVKILDGIMRYYCPNRRRPLVVEATVIDADSGWKTMTENSINSLPELVDSSLIRCELNFIECNLLGPLPERVTDAIKNADLVTMVKFLSAAYGSGDNSGSNQKLQEIISLIKRDGTFIFMDALSKLEYEDFRQTVTSSPDMTEVYRTSTLDITKMSFYSLAKSIQLNREYFGAYIPCSLTVNYVNAWSKRSAENPVKSPAVTADETYDVAAGQKKLSKYLEKCKKFCASRNFSDSRSDQEFPVIKQKMFSTKSKKKRILNLDPKLV